jgi:serine/threonine-protein kinase
MTHARDQLLADLLAELTTRQRTGQLLAFEELLADHPDVADELRELWAVAQFADALGRPAEPPTASLNGNANAPSDTAPLPRQFGDYELLRELGRGGMGVVYLARQQSLDRLVAIKVLLRGDFASPADRARFRAEAEAAARLRHGNIVQIHEVGERDGRPYFSMTYVAGRPLSRRVAEGPLPPRQAAAIVAEVARAVQHAHDQGILHRDLKPSNVILEDLPPDADPHALPWRPILTDFGLAKRMATGDNSGLTATGAIVGTPAYMSPEQAGGKRGPIGPAADVWALGAVLYELLTGRPPFQAANPVDTIWLVVEQDPVPPRLLNPGVDRDLETVCLRCLQKPAELRYRSAADLAADLEAFLNGERLAAQSSGLGYLINRVFRETHHAVVLENWGLLWIWHSLMVFGLCLATQLMEWYDFHNHWYYLLLWGGGFGVWGSIFWELRRRGGPVLFVERQIAHAWAAGTLASVGLFVIEVLLQLEPLKLSPVLALFAGMTFLFKAGTLSGQFYVAAVLNFVTAALMAWYPHIAHVIFGVVSFLCFFVPGVKYYRQRQATLRRGHAAQRNESISGAALSKSGRTE